MDLCDLREKGYKMKISKKIESLIKSIIDIMPNLLKVFFVYQEYRDSKNGEKKKKKNILSLRNLNQSNKLEE